MDQIFVVDTMQTQRVLDVISAHLPLKDLLTFERVNPQTRTAVQAYQYDRKLLFLGLPDKDLTRQLIGNDGSRLCGPILTRLCIELEMNSETTRRVPSEGHPYNWEWMVSTVRQRAAHLKELELRLSRVMSLSVQSFVISQNLCNELNQRAEAALAEVVFGQCTKLRLSFGAELAANFNTGLLPDLLRHFSALEHLQLDGSRSLPLVSSLSAPHRLKSLEVDFSDFTKSTTADPIVTDFSGLESFSVSFFGSRYLLIDGDDEFQLERLSSDNLLSELNSLTGVGWVASFEHHPPTRMKHIQLPILARWSLSLLVASRSASLSACSSLTIDYIVPLGPQLAAEIQNGPVGQYLQRVSQLKGGFGGERPISEFLAFTPSLTVLELDLELLAYRDRERFDLAHPLQSLRKLTIVEQFDAKVREWIESVRRQAPPGLEVVLKDGRNSGPDHDYIFEISEDA